MVHSVEGYSPGCGRSPASRSVRRGIPQSILACFTLLVFLCTSFPTPYAGAFQKADRLNPVQDVLRTEGLVRSPVLPISAFGGLYADLAKEEPGAGFGGSWTGFANFPGETQVKTPGIGNRSLTRHAAVFAGAYLRKILYPFHHFP